MRIAGADGSRHIVHVKPKSDGSEFITVTNKSGVQWASCNTGTTDVQFLPPVTNISHTGEGVSWATWLFVIPGLAAAGLALAIATPSITISGGITLGAVTITTLVETLAAGMGISLAALTAEHQLELLQRLGNALGSLLPAGSRVQFVRFETPCSETAGVDF